MFTSDVPLLGKTEKSEGNRERERENGGASESEQASENRRETEEELCGVAGLGGGMVGARYEAVMRSVVDGFTFPACLWSCVC